MSEEPLSFEDAGDDASVVVMRGDHDIATARELRELLGGLVALRPITIVDLNATAFIDSSILGVLLGALRSAREAGHQLGFVLADEAGSPVGTLFGLTGLRLVFQIHRTRAEALEAMRAAGAAASS